MALRNIVKIGDAILRQKSRPVDSFDGRLAALLDDLAETLDEAQGAGLAAVQVGILKRVAVVRAGGALYELINPVIIRTEGTVCDSEGCLSIPGRRAEVERPKAVTVRTFDRRGNLKEFTLYDYNARAICHEIDHMDGILFIDRAKAAPEQKKAQGRKGAASDSKVK